jgi:pyruvate dehydrogenase E2 component (dihydrolipoamide acetyltransferase)
MLSKTGSKHNQKTGLPVRQMGRWSRQPWGMEGNVVPRLILPLSVSFDHRIIDGAHAIAFMREIVNLLEKPASLML